MNSKLYLPGLNGLRAIAAFSVIFSHIGLDLDKFGLHKFAGYDLANFGVTIFFTLSGFLITYLLICEKQISQTIDIKKFYIRRILRIWPLYFTYLLFVVIYLKFKTNSDIYYYIFIIPNIPFTLNSISGIAFSFPLLAHYWSLGVEEQFYAFWPWIIKRTKKIKLFIVIFVIGFFFLKMILTLTHSFRFLQVFLHYTRFGCLAIGAFGAYLFYNRKEEIKILNKPLFEISAWLVILLIAFKKFHLFSIIDHEIVALVTVVIIFNQINNDKKLVSLENKIFDYLGKISFGLYIYNPLVIVILAGLLKKFSYLNYHLFLVSIYVLAFFSVVLVSHISYYFFEIKFLKMKQNFTTIQSAASASESKK